MNNNNNKINELDNTAHQIKKQLQKDGRKSYRQIAKELQLNVGTITNRVQKLKKKGIIKGFKLKLKYIALGYNIETMIELDNTKNITNI